MRKSMMRIRKIMAGVLVAALVAAGTPVYANVSADSIVADEIEESTVSADEAVNEIISEEAVSEDIVADESASEDAVADEAPSYQLTYNTLADGTLEITRYTGEAKGDLIIPENINGKKVTKIGAGAFYEGTGFNGKLVLPKSLTTIGDSAFLGCSGLTGALVLPDSLISMGQSAFYRCEGFTGDLVIPDSVTTIGNEAFTFCYGFDGALILPDGLISIGERAFEYCHFFTGELKIPDSVTTIGEGAFATCFRFTGHLVLPEGLTNIEERTFFDCEGFTGDLVIPDSVTTIGAEAFSTCPGFTGKLVIPDSVTTIGNDAFYDLKSIRMVTNRSGVNIPLSNSDSDGQNITWIDAATGETITEIANGTAIRSDAYGFSNEDNFTHSTVPDAVYTGKKIVPDITVYHGRNTLRKNKDYTITYKSNVAVGTASFTIKGKGKYKGTATDTFNIIEKSISENDVKISDIPMIRESGKTYTPVPTITYNKKKLKKGIDFTIKYYRDGNLSVPVTPAAAGNYIAKIKGINNFKGEKKLSFEITPAAKTPVRNLTVVKIPSQKYTGGAIEPEVTVKNGKKILKAGEDYKILDYENNVLPGTAKVIIEGVRKKGYAGKRTVTFSIVGFPITKTIVDGYKPSFVYDGTEKNQDDLRLYKDKIKDGVSRLKGISEEDYEIIDPEWRSNYDYIYSYEKNIDAGTAVMTMTGINGCSGTLKKTYKILPYDIKKNEGDKVSVSLDTVSYSYTGSAIKPKPVVKYGDRTLTEGIDYTLSYANNVGVNDGKGKKKPTVKVTGKGNFKGTGFAMTFAITKAYMEFAGLKIIPGATVSNNKRCNWRAKIEVVRSDGKKLKQGRDYTVRYTLDAAGADPVSERESKPEGTLIYVHVTATEKSPYIGEITYCYNIGGYDLNKLTAVVSPKVYTGGPVKLNQSDITWKSGKKVVNGVHFNIDNQSYLNNVNPGTATVRVVGWNGYTGTKTIKFRIATRKILWWWI